MLGHSIDRNGQATQVFGDATKERVKPHFDRWRDPRHAQFRAEDNMVEILSPGTTHKFTPIDERSPALSRAARDNTEDRA
jgi:cytosine/adenosine deaminase-related metal-dependent hydrolase